MTFPLHPPAEWFTPISPEPHALIVTDEGRVSASVARFADCHSGHLDQCTQAPRSPSGYAVFRTGLVRCEDGSEIAVGRLTMDGPHAPLHANASETARHYDDTTTAVADVAAGETDDHVWIAGALRPGVTPEQVRALRASSLSGDWRQVERGQGLDLLAVLAVNVPGFVTPRAHVTASAGTVTLVASSGAVRPLPDAEDELTPDDLRWLRRLASQAARTEAERLRNAVHGPALEHAAKLAALVHDEQAE